MEFKDKHAKEAQAGVQRLPNLSTQLTWPEVKNTSQIYRPIQDQTLRLLYVYVTLRYVYVTLTLRLRYAYVTFTFFQIEC